MTNDTQPQGGQNACPESTTAAFTPADQPKAPNADWNNQQSTTGYCKPPDWPLFPPPDLPPDKCEPCCECPVPPNKPTDCIDALINDQTSTITAAERAKSFKTDLEALAQKAKTAQVDYTQVKYQALLERWKQEDKLIVELIAKLVCAVKCWRCVLECRVCSLFVIVRNLERQLNGHDDNIDKLGQCKGKTDSYNPAVDSLYDIRYWQTKDQQRKQAKFDRVKSVLAAWEKPAQTIEKVLNDNATLIQSAGKTLAPDMPTLLYDVFMKLVPMHLLIAPPVDAADASTTTAIDKKYTKLCPCDPCTHDNCCGPDVGTPSLLERLLGPQPYLVKPEQYMTIICCLTKTQYLPAKEALASAEGALDKTESVIKRTKADIDDRIKSIEKDAKTELAKDIDCDKEKPKPKEKPKEPPKDGSCDDNKGATQQGSANTQQAGKGESTSQTSSTVAA
jgi:hypothetical protein